MEEQMELLIKELLAAVESGDTQESVRVAEKAVKSGTDPIDYFQNCLAPVMNELGDRFARMEIFLPELMIASEAADAIREELIKFVDVKSDANNGTIVVGTIAGDNHDIGKKMVATLLSVNGYQIIDLGTDVDPMNFINTAKKENADMIAVSSLLSTSMPFMAEMIEYLVAMGLRDQVKVIVGGGPVNQEWALEVGADGYGHDAKEAVELCNRLLG
jgi:5-methyltetrahydrofolate--homocysteine methyltransferase